MIGLAAAVALFAASLWMLVDWWCDPRPLPTPRVRVDPLRRLRRLLQQAELAWPADRVAGAEPLRRGVLRHRADRLHRLPARPEARRAAGGAARGARTYSGGAGER